jgi:hypothetical protein
MKKFLSALFISFILIGIASTSHAVLIQSESIITAPTTTDNLWSYSYIDYNSAITSSSYFTTLSSEYESAGFQGYVTGSYGPWPSTDSFSSHNGTNWVNGNHDTHIFETYIMSSIDQTVALRAGGDDGHSIFINDIFYGGAGYSYTATAGLSMIAGTSYKISLVQNNYGGPWSSWFNLQEDGQNSTRFSEATYISMNATGNSAPVPEPSTIVLMGLGLVGLAGLGRKKFKQ